jgi:hypothetical protein
MSTDDREQGEAAAQRGWELGRDGDWVGAERELRRADGLGSARGAALLGELLRRRGDLGEAEAAAGRAADRGDANGAGLLANMMRERGDFEAAHSADRRADDLGSAGGAYNVACWLAQHDDWDGALAANRRADERGSAQGAFALGSQLRNAGDTAGALAAWLRGAERGHERAALNLASALWTQGDLEGAERVLRHADELGGAEAAFELGRLLARQDRRAEGEAAFGRAQKRGSVGVAHLIDIHRRGSEAERLVAALPDDARDLTAHHGATISKLGSLMLESAEVTGELAEQLHASFALAIERGAPDDDEDRSIAPYLSRQERDDLAATIDSALDAANASETITAWIERSHAAPVIEQFTGEPLEPPQTDEQTENPAELKRLRDELRHA